MIGPAVPDTQQQIIDYAPSPDNLETLAMRMTLLECAVEGCIASSNGNVILYPVPNHEGLIEAWKAHVLAYNTYKEALLTNYVCSKHFAVEDRLPNNKLAPTAVPMIFPNRRYTSCMRSERSSFAVLTYEDRVALEHESPMEPIYTFVSATRQRDSVPKPRSARKTPIMKEPEVFVEELESIRNIHQRLDALMRDVNATWNGVSRYHQFLREDDDLDM